MEGEVISDLRVSQPLRVRVFWEDLKEPTHVLERADHSGSVPIYHTVCGSIFKWGQDKTGPHLLWRGWYDFKLSSDCEACVFIVEHDGGRQLAPLPKGVMRYINGQFVEVTDSPRG